MDGELLERVYQENLEERIIAYLSEVRGISLEAAMNIYYHSMLADKIHRGVEGVQYLDHKVLVEILCDTEKELFMRSDSKKSEAMTKILFICHGRSLTKG